MMNVFAANSLKPEDRPIRDVSLAEFRSAAALKGWQPESIRLFCKPPYTHDNLAGVGKERLRIVPLSER